MAAWKSYDSPQMRRLRSDAGLMERLRDESSIFQFRTSGNPPQRYLVEFLGNSLTRESPKVTLRGRHQVEIKLGASYPRTMPEIRWLTPIFHPNISEIGMVCLGGYGTNWVPSLRLDALCVMLWDMARYFNYDIRSPYNREAALWVAQQTGFSFPIDPRPLRDVRAEQGRIEPAAKIGVEVENEEPPVVLELDEPPPDAAQPETEPILLVIDDPPAGQPLFPPTPPPLAHRPAAPEEIVFILD